MKKRQLEWEKIYGGGNLGHRKMFLQIIRKRKLPLKKRFKQDIKKRYSRG